MAASEPRRTIGSSVQATGWLLCETPPSSPRVGGWKQCRRNAADGVPVPQRYWAILAVLDGAIANVALSTIARDVNVSPAASIWVVNACL